MYQTITLLLIVALAATAVAPASTSAAPAVSGSVAPVIPRVAAPEIAPNAGDTAEAPIQPAVLSATTPNTYTLRGPENARLRSFAFDRQQPNTVWALFDTTSGVTRSGRGYVRSTDGGRTWKVPFRRIDYGFGIGNYIKVDPTDSNIVFADNWVSFDGGTNWLKADSGLSGVLNEIVIPASNHTTIYGRINDTLYRSTDGASSWKQLPAPGPRVDGIVGHPSDAKTLYAYTAQCSNSATAPNTPGCLMVSTDSGNTWRDISPRVASRDGTNYYAQPRGLVVLPPATTGKPPTLLMAAQSSSYTYYDNTTSTYQTVVYTGVFRSTDNGTTWTAGTGLPKVPRPNNASRATDFVRIAAPEPVRGSASDPNTAYVVANDIDVATTDPYNPYTARERLYVTRNAGASWQVVTPATPPSGFHQTIPAIAARAGTTATATTVFATVEARSTRTLAVADMFSGVRRSADNGMTWGSGNGGLSNQQFDWVKQGPDGLYAYVGNIGLFVSKDGGATWAVWSRYLFDNAIYVNSIEWDPANARTIYVGTSGQSMGVLRSTDGGTTWVGRNLGIGSADAAMLLIVPAGTNRPQALYARSGNRLLKSTNAGQTWLEMAGAPTLYAMYYDPVTPTRVYGIGGGQFGGDTSHLWRSLDGGTSWSDRGNNADVFAIDPNNSQRLYKSSSPGNTANEAREGIDVSNDGGDTWTTWEGSGYGSGRRLFGVLKTKPTTVLSAVRTDSGRTYYPILLEYSNDEAQNWVSLGNVMPGSFIHGPVTSSSLTFYSQGVTMYYGRIIRKTVCCGDLDVVVQEGRAGLWGYTFSPLPPPPPPPPAVEFSAATYQVNEDGASATITVTLSAAPVGQASVDYSTGDGTATAGQDYTTASGTLNFSAGEASKTFVVPITEDTVAEPDETIQLELTNPVKLTLGSNSLATLTIRGGGAPPAVSFASASATVNEWAGQATIQVTLSKAPIAPVTVSYASSDGTATAYNDYTPMSGQLTFEAGVRTASFAVPLVADTNVEQNETFSVALSSPSNAVLGTPATMDVTIADGGAAPVAQFAAQRTSVASGADAVSLTITLSPAARLPATVSYYTSDRTAVSGRDYQYTSGSVTFEAGQTTKTITIPLLDPGFTTTDREFAVDLSASANVQVGATATATVVITSKAHRVYVPLIVKSVQSQAGPNDPVLTVTPTIVEPSQTISVTWSRFTKTGNDWITLLASEAAGGYTIDYKYIDNETPPITFTAPSTGGDYLLRLFASGEVVAETGFGVVVPTPPPPDTRARLTLKATNVPAGATSVRWTITAHDLQTPEQVTVKPSGGKATATLRMAGGQGRIVRAEALQGDTVKGSAVQVTTFENDADTTLDFAFVATPPAVGCMGPAISVSSAAPGKFVDLKGVTIPASAKVTMLVGTVAAPFWRDANGMHFATPLGLPVGTKAQLQLAVDGVPVTCALPTLTILELPPAPGTGVALLRDLSGMIDDLSKLAVDANGQPTQLSRSYQALRDEVLRSATSLTQSPASATIDSLLAQSGVRAQIGRIRSDMAPMLAAMEATVARSRAVATTQAVPNATEFADAKAVSDENARIKSINDVVNGVSYAIAKLSVISVLSIALLVFAPALMGALAIATAMLWFVETCINVLTSGTWRIQSIDATPPASVLLAVGGKAVEWKAGAITVAREEMKVQYASIAEGILTAFLLGYGSVIFKAGEDLFKQALEETIKIILGRAGDVTFTILQGQNYSDGWLLPEETVADVPLGDAAVVEVDPVGRVVAAKGKPGYIQPCTTGIATITVGVEGDIEWSKDVTTREDSFEVAVSAASTTTTTAATTTETCQGFAAVAGGSSHAVAVGTDGSVWTWGANNVGQLGNGTSSNVVQTKPVKILGLTDVVTVAAGLDYSVAIKKDGTVWAWGRNTDGQLGDGTTTNRSKPVQVKISIGVTAVSAGERHVLAVATNGQAFAWGGNGYGQLGVNGQTIKGYVYPIAGLSGVVQVAAGRTHSLALDKTGQVWGWGYNAFGQVGDWTTDDRRTPVKVFETLPAERNVVAIAAGGLHSLAVTEVGIVYAWGWNKYGQVGNGGFTVNQTFPVYLTGIPYIRSVSAGYVHSLAIAKDGSPYSWGGNGNGQLGQGNMSNNPRPTMVNDTSGLVHAASVDAGTYNSFAVDPAGYLWAWGQNGAGQLGTGNRITATIPARVEP